MNKQVLEKHLSDSARQYQATYFHIARELYHNPETGFGEYKAVDLITKTLLNHGFDVIKGIGSLATAFRAEKKGLPKGPTVALVAEYDALPVLGHACGHNLVAAGVVGAALSAGTIINQVRGNLIVMGTPAEEGGGGKIILLEKGAWDGIDAVLSFHPAGFTRVTPVTGASHILNFDIVRVKPGQLTVYEIYNRLTGIFSSEGIAVQSHILKGAVSSALSPPVLSAVARLSAPDESKLACVWTAFYDEMCRINDAQEVMVNLGTTLKYKPLHSDRKLAQLFKGRMKQYGLAESDGQHILGASDLGNVSWEIPCLCPLISLGVPGLTLHTADFARAADPDRAGDTLNLAVQLLALTVLDLFAES